MRNGSSLEKLRAQIDEMDEHIQSLITQRAKMVQEIAALKTSCQESFYQPAREQEILHKVKTRHQGPLHVEQVIKIFRGILSACLSLEIASDEKN